MLGNHSALGSLAKDICENDREKTLHLYKLAAMRGNAYARDNLGAYEKNVSRAVMHLMIFAKAGLKVRMDAINEAAKDGRITKDDYESTLCAFQESTDA